MGPPSPLRQPPAPRGGGSAALRGGVHPQYRGAGGAIVVSRNSSSSRERGCGGVEGRGADARDGAEHGGQVHLYPVGGLIDGYFSFAFFRLLYVSVCVHFLYPCPHTPIPTTKRKNKQERGHCRSPGAVRLLCALRCHEVDACGPAAVPGRRQRLAVAG